MYKVIFLIDGFNLYHSLVNPNYRTRLERYRWLNLHKLCSLFLERNDISKDIYYFSAICNWDSGKASRHKTFISALESTGVKIILGKFKEVSKKCRGTCKEVFKTHEEKRTDVSIGVKLVSLGCQDAFDKAYILSADSDLVPAIEEVKNLYPSKKIISIFPFGKSSFELKSSCDSTIKLKEHHLSTCVFDPVITLNNGAIISCPAKWQTL